MSTKSNHRLAYSVSGPRGGGVVSGRASDFTKCHDAQLSVGFPSSPSRQRGVSIEAIRGTTSPASEVTKPVGF